MHNNKNIFFLQRNILENSYSSDEINLQTYDVRVFNEIQFIMNFTF